MKCYLPGIFLAISFKGLASVHATTPIKGDWRSHTEGDWAKPTLRDWRSHTEGDWAKPTLRDWRSHAEGDWAKPTLRDWRSHAEGDRVHLLAQETTTSETITSSVCRPQGHLGRVNALTLTPDGKTVVSAGTDGTIRVWDLARKSEKQVLPGHSASIRVLQISPDGQQVISGSTDGTIKVWNLATGKLLHTFEHPPIEVVRFTRNKHQAVIEAIALSPDGKNLVSSDDLGRIKGWDLSTGQELPTLGKLDLQSLPPRLYLGLSFNPNGRELLIGSIEKAGLSISRWNLSTGQSISTLPSIAPEYFRGSITWGILPQSLRLRALITSTLLISPDAQYAAMTAQQGLVIQNLATGESKQLVESKFAPSRFSFSSDSKTLISVSSQNMTLWDLRTGQSLQVLESLRLDPFSWPRFLSILLEDMRAIAISPDGKTIISGGFYGSLSAWDVATAKKRELSRPHQEIKTIKVSADGKIIVALIQSDKLLAWRWDLNIGQEQIIPISEGESGYEASHIAIALSPDGKLLVTGHSDGSAKLWDTRTGKKIRTLPAVETLQGGKKLGFAKGIAFSSDGKTLVKGRSYGGLEFWDLQTGQVIRALKDNVHGVSNVVIGADNQTVATVSTAESQIKLWEMRTGRELQTLKPKNLGVSDAISFDRRTLVAGDWYGNVTVWNLQTGKEIRTLQVSSSPIHSLSILPDGKTIVIGSRDSLIRFWDLETGKQVRTLDSEQPAASMLRFGDNGQMFTLSNPVNKVIFSSTNNLPPNALEWRALASFAVTADGKMLFSASRDGAVKQWDLTTGKAVWILCVN